MSILGKFFVLASVTLVSSAGWAETRTNADLHLATGMKVIKLKENLYSSAAADATSGVIVEVGHGRLLGHFGGDWIKIQTSDQKTVQVLAEEYSSLYSVDAISSISKPRHIWLQNSTALMLGDDAVASVKILGRSLSNEKVFLGEVIEAQYNKTQLDLSKGRLIQGVLDSNESCTGSRSENICAGEVAILGDDYHNVDGYTVEAIFNAETTKVYLAKSSDGKYSFLNSRHIFAQSLHQNVSCDNVNPTICVGRTIFYSTQIDSAQPGDSYNRTRRGIVTAVGGGIAQVMALDGFYLYYWTSGKTGQHGWDFDKLAMSGATVQIPVYEIFNSSGCNSNGLCINRVVSYEGLSAHVIAINGGTGANSTDTIIKLDDRAAYLRAEQSKIKTN
jgi:hypothetical protein